MRFSLAAELLREAGLNSSFRRTPEASAFDRPDTGLRR
jgi:hypothetical protein